MPSSCPTIRRRSAASNSCDSMLRRLGSNCRPLCNFLDCPKFPFCADRYFARGGLKRAGLPGRSEGSVVAKRSAPGFAFGSPPTPHTDAPGWLRPLHGTLTGTLSRTVRDANRMWRVCQSPLAATPFWLILFDEERAKDG